MKFACYGCRKSRPNCTTAKQRGYCNAKDKQMSETSEGLINAGLNFDGAHVCESQMHPLLQQLATGQANYMAQVCQQGHQNFQERYDKIQQELKLGAAEICAESWPEQINDSYYDLGVEMFKCWKQSPGHWEVASKKHKYCGIEMAKGSNGIWYACILVAEETNDSGTS